MDRDDEKIRGSLEKAPVDRVRPNWDEFEDAQGGSKLKRQFNRLREGTEFTVNGHGPFVVTGENDQILGADQVWKAQATDSDNPLDGVMVAKQNFRDYEVRIASGGKDAWADIVHLGNIDNEDNLQEWVDGPTYDWLQKREGELVLWSGGDTNDKHFRIVRVGPTRDGKVAVNTDEWSYGTRGKKVDDKSDWTTVPDVLADYDQPEKFTVTKVGVTERGMEWTDQILVGITEMPSQIEQVADVSHLDTDAAATGGVLGEEVEIADSGITRDDPITAITGIGDSSDLITDSGVETVGEWWEMGAPFYAVSPAWHDSALRDLLGAEFVDETDATDLMRVFTGYTAGNVYDDSGKKLGGLPDALFGNFPWEKSAWAWYYGMMRTDEYRPDEADNPDGSYQFAFATGEDIPRDVLRDSSLSGPHDAATAATTVESYRGTNVVRYPASGVEGAAYPPKPTVEFLSTLFGTDFTEPDVARQHVEVLITEGASRPSADYITIFHHPAADAHALIEGDNHVMPEDFNLSNDEVAEWAKETADKLSERKQAFRDEMRNSDLLDRAPISERDRMLNPQEEGGFLVDDRTGVRGEYHPDDLEDPEKRSVFESLLGDVYDPTQESSEADGELVVGSYGTSTYHVPATLAGVEGERVKSRVVRYERSDDYTVSIKSVKDGHRGMKFVVSLDHPEELDRRLTETFDARKYGDSTSEAVADATDQARDWLESPAETVQNREEWFVVGDGTDHIEGPYYSETDASDRVNSLEARTDRSFEVVEDSPQSASTTDSGGQQVAADGGDDLDPYELYPVECPNCGSEQEIDGETIMMGGIMECPKCGEDYEIDEAREQYLRNEAADGNADEDVAGWLSEQGVNNITAHNLGEQYATVDELREAAESASKITDLHGVGDGSADEVRQALGMAEKAGGDDQPVETDGGLPWQARKVLSGAWGRYKRMLSEGREARKEVREYRQLRAEGMDAAAAINEIRRKYGQDAINFEGIEEIEEVPDTGGAVYPEDVGSSFEWDPSQSSPYDPTKEFE